MENKKFREKIRWGWALAVLVGLVSLSSIALADDMEYGSIAIKNGSPVTPNPAPVGLPTNIKFFTSGSPTPNQNGLGADAVKASGPDNNALYTIFNTDLVKGKTITVLATKNNQYSRTSKATNQTSNALDTMTFPGGAPKAYILDGAQFAQWFNDEVPLAPTGFTAVLEGYSAVGFKPIIKVSDITVNDAAHEISNYKCEIYEKGKQALLDSGPASGGVWRPDFSRLLAADAERTYTIKVLAGNYKGSGPAKEQDLLVPAPIGGAAAAIPITYNLKFSATGVNTFSIPFVIDPANNKTITAKVNGQDVRINSILDLVQTINTQGGGGQTVTSIGWYDADNQQHVGLTAIDQGVDNTIPIGMYYGGGAPAAFGVGGIENWPINLVNKPVIDNVLERRTTQYAVTVKKAVEFTLTGWLQ